MKKLSENGAIFDSEHDPHGTDFLGVGVYLDSHSQSDLVTTATKYITTHWRPVWKKNGRNQVKSCNNKKYNIIGDGISL